MFLLGNLAFLAVASIVAAQTNFFYVQNLAVEDVHDANDCHNINFTVSIPNLPAPDGPGGSPEAVDCSWQWTGAVPPSCYTFCKGWYASYWARVLPHSFSGATDLSLDIVRYHSYRNQQRDNLTVVLQEGVGAYGCSNEGEAIECCFQGVDGLNGTFTSVYNGVEYVGYEPDDMC